MTGGRSTATWRPHSPSSASLPLCATDSSTWGPIGLPPSDTHQPRSTMSTASLGRNSSMCSRDRRHCWRSRISKPTPLDGPKFVHAHLALPHDPFVFHTDGSFVTEQEAANRSWAQNYVDQVGYANMETLAFIDGLLALPPEEQPILVIQADEDPWPQRYRQNERQFDWTSATPAELREKFGILSTFYLPGMDAEAIK